MNWRTKSRLQNFCAAVPFFQEALYYSLQRYFGSLRHAYDPLPMLRECAWLISDLKKNEISIAGKRMMEIGTGRRVDMPIGMYLCGAQSVTTVDLNPLLKESLVLESIAAMTAKKPDVLEIFKGLADDRDISRRLDQLSLTRSLEEALNAANVEYRSPADATQMDLPPASVDIQFSFTVFEHVPREVLVKILLECHRILTPEGVALHHIDPSDHFSHDDKSITPINFLQFPQSEWDRLAGNRFAYQNRLRNSDYQQIYSEGKHAILAWDTGIDPRGQQLLQSGFKVDASFKGRSLDDLATTSVRVLSRPIQ